MWITPLYAGSTVFVCPQGLVTELCVARVRRPRACTQSRGGTGYAQWVHNCGFR